MPPMPSLVLAALYSAGAHGIMTLNDFKSVEGDTAMGINSLPVMLGVKRAVLLACAVWPLAVAAAFVTAPPFAPAGPCDAVWPKPAPPHG